MIIAYEGLVIYGCGGHARSVADVALNCGVGDIIFVDDNARPGELLYGFPVQKDLKSLPFGWGVIVAQGDNKSREATLNKINSPTTILANIISDLATVGIETVIEHGTFIGHHAHIGPLCKIGMGVIINTSAVVEHDCYIGDYSHISVHVTLCGKVIVGKRCFIGAGATVIDGVSIADNVIVGAGAVVTEDITSAGTYLGVPARKVHS